MVNISKQPLPPALRAKLEMRLARMFAETHSAPQAHALLSEMLTPKEHVLLMKRLSAVLLLAQGVSISGVSDMLDMSTSTTAHLEQKVHDGDFINILRAMNITPRKRAARVPNGYYSNEEAWDMLGKILRGGLPAYTNRRRR